MIGVPLAINGDGSYVVAVVAEAVEEATDFEPSIVKYNNLEATNS